MQILSGKQKPNTSREKKIGYSASWLHHKGRNKHHIEYWYDWNTKEKTPVIPYKYAIEMLCDHISAGQVYKGKEWSKEYPLKYWNEIETVRNLYNPKTEKFITVIKEEIAKDGINKIMNKKYLKEQYEKYCK